MTCQHEKPKWVVFDPNGGNVALDDNADDIAHYSMIEWCSECGSVKVGEHWIAPGNADPPWVATTKQLAGISVEIESWTRDRTLNTLQIDQLALAVDHMHRARGFLDRAFGVQTETEPPGE